MNAFRAEMPENENRQSAASQIYLKSIQVVMETFDQGALILRLPDRHLIELNPIASFILTKSDGQHSEIQVAAALAETYGISPKIAYEDTKTLYKQLSTQRIIETETLIERDDSGKDPISQDKSFFIKNPAVSSHLDEKNGDEWNTLLSKSSERA